MAKNTRSKPRPRAASPRSQATRSAAPRAPRGGGATTRNAGLPLPRLGLGLSPAVVRSLVGIVLLAFGAVTLIALVLPGKGVLTDWWQALSSPFFGSGRWLLPVVLLVAGWYVEWGPGKEEGAPWGRTLLGIALAYAGLLGLMQLVELNGTTGGRIGRTLVSILAPLLTVPGAFVILLALLVAGLLIAFDRTLRSLLAPATKVARIAADSLQDRTARGAEEAEDATPAPAQLPARNGRRGEDAAAAPAGAKASVRGGKPVRGTATEIPGQRSVWGGEEVVDDEADRFRVRPNEPDPELVKPATPAEPRVATLAPRRPAENAADGDDTGATGAEGGQEAAAVPEIEWVVPDLATLDVPVDVTIAMDDSRVHQANMNKIVDKLAQLGIEIQRADRYTAGPSFTQYEVEPKPHVKLSKIAAVEDDLAMALEAPSIRIEAPIPGKSAVGIEVPNRDRRRVYLRPIMEGRAQDFEASPLAFALGMEGQLPRAVDLAKTPHLLIAGATGSGKSVMVNALIMSLLCNATPDELQLVLVDPKRVELAAYNGLPHLKVPVITETEKAKAVLNWAVNQMEHRYRQFAGAAARNIKGYNDTRVDPADRLPYIVIIIDELADLMMREGRNVEDPIVRLAQKARATGIHMVLATQRPSVNVVTGLIKANFPSRIAFAMASQIDSRTILDQPGAEMLTGMGDMLYQPPDKPTPLRLQGVFVGDDEINRVTAAWKEQRPNPVYDLSILAAGDDSTGTVEEVADEDADKLLPEAVNVIREYDRASASLLQRRLKIGYARAARIIDQLEARGYVGAFDGSNARMVLRRDDGAGSQDEDEA